MFAVLIYRYEGARGASGMIVDRCVGGFPTQEAALFWAEKICEFVPGQDFSVFEVEHVDLDMTEIEGR